MSAGVSNTLYDVVALIVAKEAMKDRSVGPNYNQRETAVLIIANRTLRLTNLYVSTGILDMFFLRRSEEISES